MEIKVSPTFHSGDCRTVTAGHHPGATPRDSDSAGLCWGPTICIFNQFPGDTEAASCGHSENHRFKLFQESDMHASLGAVPNIGRQENTAIAVSTSQRPSLGTVVHTGPL